MSDGWRAHTHPFVLDYHWCDFLLELAGLPCSGGTFVALDGMGVLLFSCDTMLISSNLSAVAHWKIVCDFPESIVLHRVDELSMTKSGILACDQEPIEGVCVNMSEIGAWIA
jgi:hypothetical protein